MVESRLTFSFFLFFKLFSVVCHFTPLPTDPGASQELQDGDVVKIMLGSHIDGYASIIGETYV